MRELAIHRGADLSLQQWIKAREHLPGVRHALGLTQTAYGSMRPVGDLPAIAGGRPVRIVPMPAPRPITGSERRSLRRTFRAGSSAFFDGVAIREFESQVAQQFGCKHALACSSGTASLHTALMALGIGPGDEVIVPVLTYVATAIAVMQAGAVPRFVDADPAIWSLDASKIEAAITPRTRAIIPVHMAGVPCDIEALLDIARRHDLLILEDASHAHGSTWRGRSMGTIGAMGCFSLGPPKSITTGEGGIIVTDDDELAQRARIAMNLGECSRDPSEDVPGAPPEERLDYVRLGWNYRMSVAQAAIGVGQMRRFDSMRAARVRAGEYLNEELSQIPGIRTQALSAHTSSCFYTFPIEVEEGSGLTRDELLAGLAQEKIDYRLWSNIPLSNYSVFEQPGTFPVAERLCRNSVGLRTDPVLGRRDHADTVLAIRRLMAWGRER
jgi:perosamine synthetase